MKNVTLAISALSLTISGVAIAAPGVPFKKLTPSIPKAKVILQQGSFATGRPNTIAYTSNHTHFRGLGVISMHLRDNYTKPATITIKNSSAFARRFSNSIFTVNGKSIPANGNEATFTLNPGQSAMVKLGYVNVGDGSTSSITLSSSNVPQQLGTVIISNAKITYSPR